MLNDRSRPVIGANVKCLIETLSTPISVELLINNKGKLTDFSVQSENHDFKEVFISLLESGISKEFITFFNVKSMIEVDSSKFLQLYWWQLLEEVSFFINPSLSDCLSNTEMTLCRCFNISVSEVQDAISDGANDLLAVTNITKAGAGCGSCHTQIGELLSSQGHDRQSIQTEAEQAKRAKFKRDKIQGMWPAQFLLEKVYPILDSFNEANEQDAQLVGLIELNLYIKSDNKILELEELIAQCDTELILLYV